LCERIGLRWGIRWPIIIGLLASAGFLVLGAFHSDPVVAVTMLALCFLFNQLTDGAYWSASIAIGGESSGTAGGILNTGSNAIGIANALLVPWFAHQFGWAFALASGAILAVVGAVLLLFVRADEPALQESV
jgi:MFS family permease